MDGTWPSRIALVTFEYPPYIGGGTGTTAYLLANHLRHQGLSVDVYVLRDRDEEIEEGGGRVRFLRAPTSYPDPYYVLWWLSVPRLARLLRGYDLIHVYGSSITPLTVAVHYLLRKIPIVLHMNYDMPACLYSQDWSQDITGCCGSAKRFRCVQKRLHLTQYARHRKWLAPLFFGWFSLQRLFVRRVSHILLESNTLKQLYITGGFPPEQMYVCWSPYDPAFQTAIDSQPRTTANSSPIIMYVGRLAPEKNVEGLIQAFAMNAASHARLWIVGRGPSEANLRELVKALSLEGSVIIRGYVSYDQLPELYARADIFVHPGMWAEPFGRTIVEAMQAGLATVVSDVGAPPDIVGDAGLVFPAGDDAALGERLANLVNNPDLRTSMGKKARQRVNDVYSPTQFAKNIVRYYRSMEMS
jgi:alpha-maltose-1-phosphate synthase